LKFDPDEGCGTRVSKLRGERPGIPALGFRPLYVICSPLLICYVIDIMMVTGFCFLAQKAKMGKTFVAFLRLWRS
jgi:hypothetical protein